MRKVISAVMIALLLISPFPWAFNIQPVKAEPRTWIVDDDGPADFCTIQEAVNAASPGDTIIVRAGTYIENVDVTKDHLTIKSESGAEATTVKTEDSFGSIFDVSADYVNINGFTITGKVYCNRVCYSIISQNRVWGSIVLYHSSDVSVLDNNCSNTYMDCIRLESSTNCQLIGNTMFNGGINIVGGLMEHYNTHEIDASNTLADAVQDSSGNIIWINNRRPIYYLCNKTGGQIPEGAGQIILVNCTDVTVENQKLYHGYAGIELAYSSNITLKDNECKYNWLGIYLYNSNNNNISDNYCYNNDVGGIYLDCSNNNTIYRNYCASNSFGISLGSSCNNTLSSNNVASNGYGIFLANMASHNTLKSNTVSNNNGDDIYLADSPSTIIYLNNFDNREKVYTSKSVNTWQSVEELAYTYNGNTYTSYLGNYWSDYSGSDADGDGIGDNPYSIDGDKDDYPLMESFENYQIIAESPWPMFQHDPQRTGRSPYRGPQTNNLRWVVTFEQGMSLPPLVPSVGASGLIYISHYAIRSDGSVAWITPIIYNQCKDCLGPFDGAATASDGTIYTIYGNEVLYAVNSDGSLRWKFEPKTDLGSSGSYPALASDGTIYATFIYLDFSSKLFALAPDGTPMWSYQLDSMGMGCPAIGPEGTIYVAADKLYAINTDGTLKWSNDGSPRSSPIINPKGTVYIASASKIQAISPDGTLEWQTPSFLNGGVQTLALGQNGVIYVIDDPLMPDAVYKLYAINRDGIRWNYIIKDRPTGPPAVDAEGTVYLSTRRHITAINANGSLMWEYTFGDETPGCPVIGDGGTIYITTYVHDSNGKLYAFGVGSSPPPTPDPNILAVKLIVATDKPSYKPGEKVWISYEITPNTPHNIEITITDPNQQQTTITGTPPISKHQFEYKTTSTEGTYTIQTTVTTQTQTITKTSTFKVEQPLQNILQQYLKLGENVYHWHTLKGETKTYKIYIYTKENLGQFDQTTKQHLTTSDQITGVIILDQDNNPITDKYEAQNILTCAQFHKYHQNKDSIYETRILDDELQQVYQNTLTRGLWVSLYKFKSKPIEYLNWRTTLYKDILTLMVKGKALEHPTSELVQMGYDIQSYIEKGAEFQGNQATIEKYLQALNPDEHPELKIIQEEIPYYTKLSEWFEEYQTDIIMSKYLLTFLCNWITNTEISAEQTTYLEWFKTQTIKRSEIQQIDLYVAVDEMISDYESPSDDLMNAFIDTVIVAGDDFTELLFKDVCKKLVVEFLNLPSYAIPNAAYMGYLSALDPATVFWDLTLNLDDQIWLMHRQLAASELQEIALQVLKDQKNDPSIWCNEPKIQDISYSIKTMRLALLCEAEFYQSEITINQCGGLRDLVNFINKLFGRTSTIEETTKTVNYLTQQAKLLTPGLQSLDKTTKQLFSQLRPLNDPVPYTSIKTSKNVLYVNEPIAINITVHNPYLFNLDNIWINSTINIMEYNPNSFYLPLIEPNMNITLTSYLTTNKTGIININYKLYAENNTIVIPLQTSIFIYNNKITHTITPENPLINDKVIIKVKDSIGYPIANATIKLTTNEDTKNLLTNNLGEITFNANQTGLYTYIINKTNYPTTDLHGIVIGENIPYSNIFNLNNDITCLHPNKTQSIPFTFINTGQENNTIQIKILETSSDINSTIESYDSISVHYAPLNLINETNAVGLLKPGQWCSGLVNIKTPQNLDGNHSVLIKTTVNEDVELLKFNFSTTPSLHIDISNLSNHTLTHNENASLKIELFDNRGLIIGPNQIAVFFDGINVTSSLGKNGTGTWLLNTKLPWGLHIISVEAEKPGYINGTETMQILVHESTLKLDVSTDQIDYTLGSPLQLNASLRTNENLPIINGTVTVRVSTANHTHTQMFIEDNPGQYLTQFTVNPDNPTTYINLTVTAKATGYKEETLKITIPTYPLEIIENNLTINEVDIDSYNATLNVKLRNYYTNTTEAALFYQITDSKNVPLEIIKKQVNVTSNAFIVDSTTFTLNKSSLYNVNCYTWSGLPCDDSWKPLSKPLRIVFNDTGLLQLITEEKTSSLLQVQPDKLSNCTLLLEPIKSNMAENESVEIKGSVYSDEQPICNIYVGVQVTNPNEEVCYLNQILTDEQGRFKTTYTLPFNSVSGKYDTIVTFSGKQIQESFNLFNELSVIEDEIIVLENQNILLENDLIINGTGKLVLINSTLELIQSQHEQYGIFLRNEGNLSLREGSLITSDEGYRITLKDNSSSVLSGSIMDNCYTELFDHSTLVATHSNISYIGVYGRSFVDVKNSTVMDSVYVAGGNTHLEDVSLYRLGISIKNTGANVTLKELPLDFIQSWDLHNNNALEGLSQNLTLTRVSVPNWYVNAWADNVSLTVIDSSLMGLSTGGNSVARLVNTTVRGWFDVLDESVVYQGGYLDVTVISEGNPVDNATIKVLHVTPGYLLDWNATDNDGETRLILWENRTTSSQVSPCNLYWIQVQSKTLSTERYITFYSNTHMILDLTVTVPDWVQVGASADYEGYVLPSNETISWSWEVNSTSPELKLIYHINELPENYPTKYQITIDPVTSGVLNIKALDGELPEGYGYPWMTYMSPWIPESNIGENVTVLGPFGIYSPDGPILRVEELVLPINETDCYVVGWELEQGYSETDLWWYTVESRLLARFYMNWPNYDAEMLFWLTSFNPTGKPVNGSLQVQLYTGWNLIGMPFTGASVEQLFGDNLENIQTVYGYSNGKWKYWLPDIPSTLTNLSGGSGYWIQSYSSFSVTIEGDLVEQSSLNSEWNLITVNTSKFISVEKYITKVSGEVAYIYGYNEIDQTYLYWLNNLSPEFQTLTSMYPGKGYWVYCNP